MKIKLCLFLVTLAVIGQSALALGETKNSIKPIPSDIQKLMLGSTWHPGCPISLDQLSYLRIHYWGFDNRRHLGELVVNKKIAKETMVIFQVLYNKKFPIRMMVLPARLRREGKSEGLSDDTHGFRCDQDGDRPV